MRRGSSRAIFGSEAHFRDSGGTVRLLPRSPAGLTCWDRARALPTAEAIVATAEAAEAYRGFVRLVLAEGGCATGDASEESRMVGWLQVRLLPGLHPSA